VPPTIYLPAESGAPHSNCYSSVQRQADPAGRYAAHLGSEAGGQGLDAGELFAWVGDSSVSSNGSGSGWLWVLIIVVLLALLFSGVRRRRRR
jgi:hypothetical protein